MRPVSVSRLIAAARSTSCGARPFSISSRTSRRCSFKRSSRASLSRSLIARSSRCFAGDQRGAQSLAESDAMRHAGRMVGRRTLLRGLAGALLAAPRRAAAQPARRIYRVGVLRPAPTDARFQRDFGGFRDALRESGDAEGVNLALEYRMRPGPADAILGMASDLVRLPVDVIAAISPAAVVAAAKATRTVPIVAVDLESDPLATGLVGSLAQPGGNVTGLFLDFPELAGKWLELIREAVPGLARVAVLWDPATGSAQVKAAEAAARTLRLQIQPLQARAVADLDGAVQSAVKERAGALVVL